MAKNSTYDSELQTLVGSFTSNLTLLVRRAALEQVHSALSDALGGGAPIAQKRGPGRPAGKAKAQARGGRRTSEQMDALGDSLLAHIAKNPGMRGEQISAALKTDVKTMRPAMLKLIAAKKIKTKGQRRGMTYYGA
jgi:hypothetical protein